jgi:hypothetical protein
MTDTGTTDTAWDPKPKRANDPESGGVAEGGGDDLAFCRQLLHDTAALSAAAQRLELQAAAIRAKIAELQRRVAQLQAQDEEA